MKDTHVEEICKEHMRREQMRMININEIIEYIYNEMFEHIYILHPIYAPKGKITFADALKLRMSNKQKFVCVDRNILGQLLSAVKKGSFAGGNRKETTAFLLFCMSSDLGISPYDAIKEQAFAKMDNISGTKEFDLFECLFSDVDTDVIVESFYNENITFKGKTYQEASSLGNISYTEENADYLFLYATILHFVYTLRTVKGKDEQFESFFKWYFSENLISIYALTYIVLFFTRPKITPPHNYLIDELAIEGCMNQALDLLYLQEIDPERYRSDKYTVLVATHDKVMKTVFETVHDETKYNCFSIDSYFEYLCDTLSDKKREKYAQILKELYKNHEKIDVNPQNALVVAKQIVLQEENRLKEILIV